MKGHKKATFCLIGKLSIKKTRFLFESYYLKKPFHIFSSHLETGLFSNQGSVDDKSHLQSVDAQ